MIDENNKLEDSDREEGIGCVLNTSKFYIAVCS